jgi:hypothetical protein
MYGMYNIRFKHILFRCDLPLALVTTFQLGYSLKKGIEYFFLTEDCGDIKKI